MSDEYFGTMSTAEDEAWADIHAEGFTQGWNMALTTVQSLLTTFAGDSNELSVELEELKTT